ncbi:hypothetical protein PISL3812_03807 [Talaromyces islandicus]|uniref:Uncharacterized protein n=1 Tax=Talaromyces islandicus TaxID=28573 RepID=A0A0U1LUA7_TALIS|nr:hypothetical protein PISL3812_03807 [Talaromyces islandicus]
MLNCTSACIRNLGAGARLGTRLRGRYAVQRSLLASPSHTLIPTAQKLRNISSAPFENETFASDDNTRTGNFTIKRTPTRSAEKSHEGDGDDDGNNSRAFDTSDRKVRLAESFKYTRSQAKEARRTKFGKGNNNKNAGGGGGNIKEVKMLEALAKTREMPESINPTVINKELKWLQDPKELAVRIARLLQADQVALAVAMVRKAEALKMECAVAWNRLLSYCFEKSAPEAAFSFYNDMKKRQRQPTDRTYTIMLKGLSLQIKKPGWNPVPIAQKIYRQLLDPKSPVAASHYHHHAMLEVCGNYHDMDALWNVVGELPEQGPAKPNAQTYTVILMALQNNFEHAVESLSADDLKLRSEKREGLLLDAKRIWVDVMSQWKDGELELDNELVGTMAQILLDPLDEPSSYNVLALFNQTLGVPIFARKPESRPGLFDLEKRSSERVVPAGDVSEELDFEEDVEAEAEALSEQESSNRNDPADEKVYVEHLEDVFDPVERKKGVSTDSEQRVTANNMILNSILRTCRIMTQGTSAGRQYWKYFTIDGDANSPHKIQPDLANFHEYLRLLRVARSSQGAVDMIRDQMVPAIDVRGITFHLAMSCCLRDRQNPNVFLNAQEMLSLMQKNLPLSDPRPLQGFLNLVDALISNPQWLLGLRGLASADQETTNLTTMGRNLRWSLQKAAITSLEPHVNRLYEVMENPRTVHSSGYTPESRPGMVNGFYALNFMVQTRQMLDRLLGTHYKNTLSESDRTWLRGLATKLRKFSKPDVAQQFENSQLTPLPQHWDAMSKR